MVSSMTRSQARGRYRIGDYADRSSAVRIVGEILLDRDLFTLLPKGKSKGDPVE